MTCGNNGSRLWESNHDLRITRAPRKCTRRSTSTDSKPHSSESTPRPGRTPFVMPEVMPAAKAGLLAALFPRRTGHPPDPAPVPCWMSSVSSARRRGWRDPQQHAHLVAAAVAGVRAPRVAVSELLDVVDRARRDDVDDAAADTHVPGQFLGVERGDGDARVAADVDARGVHAKIPHFVRSCAFSPWR
jgi:hypothetical protein